VTRANCNLKFSRHYSKPVDRFTGLRSGPVGKPTREKSRTSFPALLRRVRYYDSETAKECVLLTHHLEIPALTVATLYNMRWRIELFFRWIKGHLRIAILHKQLKLTGTLHRTLPLLSVHPFEKTTLNGLLMEIDHRACINADPNQLNLFEL